MDSFDIQQFEDKGLAIYSYLIIDRASGHAALIDPTRNPAPFLEALKQAGARLMAIIETHPHADFVSGHLELHTLTGAPIYCSALTQPAYLHQPLAHGDRIPLGNLELECRYTPGHSPDSITLVLHTPEGGPIAAFTGDTLFIGDVGRPDLREQAGRLTATRRALAADLYHSLKDQLLTLPDSVAVYPGHGAGSLCGKGLSTANRSTIGAERLTNPALAHQDVDSFVNALLEGQPFMPRYFGQSVEINSRGAQAFEPSLAAVPRLTRIEQVMEAAGEGFMLVDTRPREAFRKGHLPGSINLQPGSKFETWLGSIVDPREPFLLIAPGTGQGEALLERAAMIGYEAHCHGLYTGPVPAEVQGLTVTEAALEELRARQWPAGAPSPQPQPQPALARQELLEGGVPVQGLDPSPVADPVVGAGKFHVLDVRNPSEVATRVFFQGAQHIPLPDLRDRILEVPTDRPLIVHCAAGYRSAAAASILQAARPELRVLDLGDQIAQFS